MPMRCGCPCVGTRTTCPSTQRRASRVNAHSPLAPTTRSVKSHGATAASIASRYPEPSISDCSVSVCPCEPPRCGPSHTLCLIINSVLQFNTRQRQAGLEPKLLGSAQSWIPRACLRSIATVYSLQFKVANSRSLSKLKSIDTLRFV